MPGKNLSGGGSFYRQGGKLTRLGGNPNFHHLNGHPRNGSNGSENGAGNGSNTNRNGNYDKENLAVRQAHKKLVKLDSYLADDENFPSFKAQLAQMGLELRDIPADGNCLFRALGDQLEGHCRNHYRHRAIVANFMKENKPDFEPFVEDDVSFENHLSHLQKLGTHAGNDAIVAFARLHQSVVVIHQLNGKPLLIQGCGNNSHLTRQFHIAYHNGDHYSSVRRLGDNTESPAHIRIEDVLRDKNNYMSRFNQKFNKGQGHGHLQKGGMVSARRGLADIEREVILATNCNDIERIQASLMDCDYDVDSTIADILQQLELSNEAEGDATSLSSQQNSSDSGVCPNSPTLSSNTITSTVTDASSVTDSNNNSSMANNDNQPEKTTGGVLKTRTGSSSSANGKGHKVHFREDSFGGSSGYGSMSSNKGAKSKMGSDKKTKEMKKQEKKKRAEDARRQKHMKSLQGNTNGVSYHPHVRDVTVVTMQDGRLTKI